ncbi:hypothetical protein [Kocuria nitroreducens]|uniref:hypothetical protein n=1 Tax=Kocuria nitroreducens TaxID=3058914 RepID=UPI0036DE64A7
MGIVSGVVLAVILFIAYFCGGYVAGRMARFDGAKQGIAVWLGDPDRHRPGSARCGGRIPVQRPGSAQRLPPDPDRGRGPDDRGIIALIIAALVPLIGAVLGGMAGMRFHRKVDQVGTNHQAGLGG